MKHFVTIPLFFVLFFISCLSQEGPNEEITEEEWPVQPATLSVSLKPDETITFNIFRHYGQTVRFRNDGDQDTVVTQRFSINQPFLLVNGGFLVVADGDPIFRTYTVLLNPGDSVSLARGTKGVLTMYRSTGFPNFIDSLIPVPKDYYFPGPSRQPTGTYAVDVKEAVRTTEATFGEIEAAIAGLDISETQAKVLRSLNGNVKYTAIARLLADPAISHSGFTDSLYEDMFGALDDILSIDALNNGDIYRALVVYGASSGNEALDKNDFWACAAAADSRLKQTEAYKQHLIGIIAASFANTPENIASINQELQVTRTEDQFLDTLYQLTEILQGTFTDFSKAKEDLAAFADGRFYFILGGDEQSANHEMKTVSGLPSIDLYDFAGSKSDFKHVVMGGSHRLTVVDLWASWCVPCIAEIPHWEKAKDQLKDKPIRFVSVSIDKEEDVGKWVSVAKQHGIHDHPDQYRLANFRESPLTKLLNIRNIPRYLVINDQGDVLDDDFHRPSKGEFELTLLGFLEKK